MAAYLLVEHNMAMNANDGTFRDSFEHSNESGIPLSCAIFHKSLVELEHLLMRGADPEVGNLPPTAHAIGDRDRE